MAINWSTTEEEPPANMPNSHLHILHMSEGFIIPESAWAYNMQTSSHSQKPKSVWVCLHIKNTGADDIVNLALHMYLEDKPGNEEVKCGLSSKTFFNISLNGTTITPEKQQSIWIQNVSRLPLKCSVEIGISKAEYKSGAGNYYEDFTGNVNYIHKGHSVEILKSESPEVYRA